MGTPIPNEVIYKRRRVAALIILLVIIALFIWAVVALRGGSDSEAENAAASSELTSSTVETTTTTSSSTVETSTSPATASSAEESVEPEVSTSTSAPKNSCELADLIVTASTDKPNYSADEQPTLFMTVDNPTAADCEINLDDEVLRFEVYNLATNVRIWSDVDCNPAVESGTRVFPADEVRHFQATWSRTNSAPEQCSNRELVPVGSYFLHSVLGDNPSQPQTFNLN